jgi:16S rRNA processing protein RimM
MAYQLIGKLTATYGLDGMVVLHHTLTRKSALHKLSHLFIELKKESYIPFFIEEHKAVAHDEVLLLFDEIDSVEKAKQLIGKNVFIEEETFTVLQPNAVAFDMIGFTIKDKHLGVLGLVEHLYETPGQVLAAVTYNGKEALLPLVDATIVHIDVAQKTILVNLPKGLLDIYL